MYQRDSTNNVGSGKFSSLNFLRKPQRVVSQVENSVNNDIVKRNTDINKSIRPFEGITDENSDNAFDGEGLRNLRLDDGKDPLEKEDWKRGPEEVEMIGDYFTASKMQGIKDSGRPNRGQFYVYGSASGEEQSSGVDTTETEEEYEAHTKSFLDKGTKPTRPSILLHRSKSLPTTPSNEKNPAPILNRSKSVHFAQSEKFEVRYFRDDESPLVLRKETEDSFTTYPIKLRKSRRHRDRECKGNSPKKSLTLENGNLILRSSSSSMLKLDIFDTIADRTQLGKSQQLQTRSQSPKVDQYVQNPRIGSDQKPCEEYVTRIATEHISQDEHPPLQINENFVCHLYDLRLDPIACLLVGNIFVKNISYEKRVLLRYTLDAWKSQHDIESVWISSKQHAVIGGSLLDIDVFRFAIEMREITTSIHLEMCILYQTRDGPTWSDHWDNNRGNNYRVNLRLS